MINDKMLRTVEGRCKECYACIRVCPVKAIRSTSGRADVVPERCVNCGQCVVACTQCAIGDQRDLEKVGTLLASGKLVVLALAPEYPASFCVAPPRLEATIERAGFYSVEELVFGEELVAGEYARLLEITDGTLIRSTCPTVTSFIEKYHPALVHNLASLVHPAIAQARLIKEIYGDVDVVYAGPCFAMKSEAARSGSIEAAITFKELKELLGEYDAVDDTEEGGIRSPRERPKLRRSHSVAGGLPRDLIANISLIDSDVRIVRGLEALSELAEAICRGETSPKFVDALACDGCIDGPGLDSALSIFARKGLVAQASRTKEAGGEGVAFSEIEPVLPEIDLARGFAKQGVSLPQPTDDEIRQVMAAAEKLVEADELNCGGCGYPTCWDMAVAVYQGLASWVMCFPYQKRVFARTVRELKESSATDGLTGLPNHKNFEERLASEFYRARRYGAPLSLVMVDVDLFKNINDNFGHLGGNRFLRSIARIVKDHIRQSDFAARYGGDEFVIILPETEGPEALAAGEKLRKHVEGSAIPLGGGVARATLSLGVSTLKPEMKRPSDLIERADQALYQAKRAGRNRARAAQWS